MFPKVVKKTVNSLALINYGIILLVFWVSIFKTVDLVLPLIGLTVATAFIDMVTHQGD